MMRTTMIFKGGLGNQMFQYALVCALRSRGIKVTLDKSLYLFTPMHNGYELNRVFSSFEEAESRGGLHLLWLRFLMKYRVGFLIKTDKYVFDESVFISPKRYLSGYWQSELYFQSIADMIRNAFVFKNIDEINERIANKMSGCNSVSLHIRRGDYASYGMTIIGGEYYAKAIRYINQVIESPVFYIISDDQKEAQQIVQRMNIDYQMVDINHGNDSYKDMYLMSKCKHNIIANSSFSWWGGWLNNNVGRIVIAPKNWDAQNLSFCPQAEGWVLL